MKAVILAGGLGSRLKPFSEIIPKPLLPLGEKAVTEVQIQQLHSAGFTDVFLATNYKSNYVEAFLGDGSRYGIRLHYSKEDKPLGTCGPLTLLKKHLTEPFLVMNGDVLSKLNFAEFVRFGNAQDAALTVMTKIVTTPFRFGNVLVDAENRVIGVEEKPDIDREILAGVYFMKPAIFNYIPENEYYGMDKLIKDLLADSQSIGRYLLRDYWIDIGQVEDYSQARDAYKQHFADIDAAPVGVAGLTGLSSMSAIPVTT